MNDKTILQKMGIQQWRLREGIKPDAVETNEHVEEIDKAVVDPSAKISPDEVAESSVPKEIDWAELIKILNDQDTCPSCAQSRPILGDGNPSADWMFVYDSPSLRDIEQQQLLTGRAGQLFDGILAALSLDRSKVYLSSVFKCPPAEDLSSTMPQCADLVTQQIILVKPKVVIALGEFVAQSLIKANESLEQLRRQPQKHFDQMITIVPTYGLTQMLESPSLKADVWADLKSAINIVATQ